MKVRQLMVQKIISVAEDTPLADVITLMLKLKLGSLIVKNHQGQLAGIITHSDVLSCTSKELRKSAAFAGTMPAARDIMSSNPVTITEDESIQKAARTMSEKNISKLVVIGEDRELTGIITTSDLILALGTQLVEEDIADYLAQVLRLKKVQREIEIEKEN